MPENKDNKNENKGRQSTKRMLVKTIIYRIVGATITFLVSYFFLGEISTSIGISFFTEGLQTIMYFINECAWNVIDWENGTH
tara:strand:+ start:111 stop:356 length:246 start_codon:yes stop_codon:yes gene_type:complete